MPPTVPDAVASSAASATRCSAERACTLCQHLKGQRQQRVARQNRHGLTEYLVTSRTSPAEVVVVERGKIVMNQRVGVDYFQRACRIFQAVHRIGNRTRGAHAQHGPNSLASSKQAVPHSPVDTLGRLGVSAEPTCSGQPPPAGTALAGSRLMSCLGRFKGLGYDTLFRAASASRRESPLLRAACGTYHSAACPFRRVPVLCRGANRPTQAALQQTPTLPVQPRSWLPVPNLPPLILILRCAAGRSLQVHTRHVGRALTGCHLDMLQLAAFNGAFDRSVVRGIQLEIHVPIFRPRRSH